MVKKNLVHETFDSVNLDSRRPRPYPAWRGHVCMLIKSVRLSAVMQRPAKIIFLGCVTLSLCQGRVMQPRKSFLADLCTLSALSFCLSSFLPSFLPSASSVMSASSFSAALRRPRCFAHGKKMMGRFTRTLPPSASASVRRASASSRTLWTDLRRAFSFT